MTDILIDLSEKRDGLPEFDESVPCKHCGPGHKVVASFGLAGGGFGPYTVCESCSTVITKSVVDDSDEA